ncbi:MAG: replication-relaxation family protein [Bdellovibrionota bacterium]
MQLTTRDKVLFHLLCRHNLLSTKQIQRTVFAELELSTVMRRLRKLQAAGFIVRLGMLTCRTWVWGCSQLAHELFTGFTSSHRTNLHTLHHDVTLTDVRLLFEELTRVDEWFDIRHIKTGTMPPTFHADYNTHSFDFAKGEAALMPDALFLGYRKDVPFSCALQLELSIKANIRYRKILQQYTYKKHPGTILYVVHDEKIRTAVLKTSIQNLRREHQLFTVQMSELIRNRDNAVLQKADGKTIRFHELFDCRTRRDVQSVAQPVGKLLGNPLKTIKEAQLVN